MPIYFNCPTCTAALSAPDTAGGEKRKCPVCNQPVEIPNASTRQPDSGAAGTPAPENRPAVATITAPAAALSAPARQPEVGTGLILVSIYVFLIAALLTISVAGAVVGIPLAVCQHFALRRKHWAAVANLILLLLLLLPMVPFGVFKAGDAISRPEASLAAILPCVFWPALWFVHGTCAMVMWDWAAQLKKAPLPRTPKKPPKEKVIAQWTERR